MKIGKFTFCNKTVLAPMAGITDLIFRKICQSFGAGLVVNSIQIEDILLYICIIKLLCCNEMLYKMVVVAVC